MFYHCFGSIIFRDLETVDRSEVSIQCESIQKKNADLADLTHSSLAKWVNV